MESSWEGIVEAVGEKKRTVWTALAGTTVVSLVDDVVTIGFPSLASAEVLKKPQGSGLPVNAELVRDAILAVTGHRVRFKVQELAGSAALETDTVAKPTVSAVAPDAVPDAAPASEPVNTQTASWPTVTLPGATEEPEVIEADAVEVSDVAPELSPEEPTAAQTEAMTKVGEAVIREVLGGQLISEHVLGDEDGE
jgi:hypothetical protein